jgi:tRNA G10  N-methylase Trm11
MSRIGGSYKIAKVLGNDLVESLERIELPVEPKFYWTISGYGCRSEAIAEAQENLRMLLKKSDLGKSKFLQGEALNPSNNTRHTTEMKAASIYSRILSPNLDVKGIDFVLQGSLDSNRVIYAQTTKVMDIEGFNQRDFKRPNQNPAITLSPRLARLLINLTTTKLSKSLLDPFCGVGTILAEALLCDYAVVGVDKDERILEKAKMNLKWLVEFYGKNPARILKLFPYDAISISKAKLGKVDSVVTEPILLPTFKDNPSPARTDEMLGNVRRTYEKTIQQIPSVLSRPGSRIALVSPIIVDAAGGKKSFALDEAASAAGFTPYRGRGSVRAIEYPLAIESSKKRIVQRAINVFHLR